MNWLLDMFSEFSENVIGDGEASARKRQANPREGRKRLSGSKRSLHKKKRTGDRFPDWDW